MRQIIPFTKDIVFDTKISEITSITLEQNLKLENNGIITGNFIVGGKYKINNISINEEDFEKKLDCDITLNNEYDVSKITIEIDNFYYEIVNDDVLRVHIDVLLDNLVLNHDMRCIEDEIINVTDDDKKDVIENLIDDDNDIIKKDDGNDIIKKDDDVINVNEKQLENNIMNNILKDTYSTYKIHIIRKDETVETIKEMYNISNDELEKYNNLEKISDGSKIIIPITNE